MRCVIVLHSTTGNTKLVARYAAARLRQAGFEVDLHDMVRHPKPPDLSGVDLLGLASPTMYFRPTLAAERFVQRLPELPKATRPAFLLGTAGGDPGDQFPILADLLAHKGWMALGGHWVIFPTNWPPQRMLALPLRFSAGLGSWLGERFSGLRPYLALAWPDAGVPDMLNRKALDRFLDRICEATLSEQPPTEPGKQPRGLAPFAALGRAMTREKMQMTTRIRIDAQACTACGICAKNCPVACLTQSDEQSVPLVGDNCTGCWACYNHCPDRAITGWVSPAGMARYRGPAAALKTLFHS
jgi:NAD-dependent dihydropyrimidine dehydrogenase PreA subunit/flavodoxin